MRVLIFLNYFGIIEKDDLVDFLEGERKNLNILFLFLVVNNFFF